MRRQPSHTGPSQVSPGGCVPTDLLIPIGLAALAPPMLLDSGEPRCTSHTVSMMNSRNCRYSDCQFSATSTAKVEDIR